MNWKWKVTKDIIMKNEYPYNTYEKPLPKNSLPEKSLQKKEPFHLPKIDEGSCNYCGVKRPLYTRWPGFREKIGIHFIFIPICPECWENVAPNEMRKILKIKYNI